jgi:hypothetical protein
MKLSICCGALVALTMFGCLSHEVRKASESSGAGTRSLAAPEQTAGVRAPAPATPLSSLAPLGMGAASGLHACPQSLVVPASCRVCADGMRARAICNDGQFDRCECPEGDQDCVIGGCSRQLCSEAADGPLGSTCEWLEACACYRTASCERQNGGACGWTMTAELRQCLADAVADGGL